jgi:Na+:H+ antiporter, NhaA family
LGSNPRDSEILPPPPGAWGAGLRLVERMRVPVERFLAVEAASGIVLFAAAAVALIWANSAWQPSYAALWHTSLGFRLGPWSFERDLHFWINDGLMAVFFFVVGLEIRREIHQGQLSELRRAALPLVAALGGMLVPALAYLALNHGRASAIGWGVPMATDIAFAVGVLALLGRRAGAAMRILLLALAVIDDVGAILVIAIFYSGGIEPLGLGVFAAGVGAVFALQGLGVRAAAAYALPALVMWGGAYGAGLHPTLAGVALGLLTPVRAWLGRERSASRTIDTVREYGGSQEVDEQELLAHLDHIGFARREAVSPLERVLHALHGWVAFGILPIFALANAGVPLAAADFNGDGTRVFVGILLGLVVGKPLGILGLSWCAARFGLVVLPRSLGLRHVGLVGGVAGIGFTMALFIAELAFPPGPLLQTAKLSIIVASALAAGLSLGLGRSLLSAPRPAADPDSAPA